VEPEWLVVETAGVLLEGQGLEPEWLVVVLVIMAQEFEGQVVVKKRSKFYYNFFLSVIV
jgi:hypothetical protein